MRTFACLLGTVLLPCALAAQVGVTTPAPYSGVMTRVGGSYVTPIPNIPFTATVDISSMRIMPDGTQELRKTTNHIARDSRGRIYNERRMLVPVSYEREPVLTAFHIFDPQTRLSTDGIPATHLAHQWVMPEPRNRPIATAGVPPPPHGAKTEDLGPSTLADISVRGTRYTIEVPAERSGTGKPMQVKDEYWYSEDLRMNMMIVHSDPRTGQQIVTLTAVSRAEPDAKIFEIPEGYRIVDETPVTPPPSALPAHTAVAVAPVK